MKSRLLKKYLMYQAGQNVVVTKLSKRFFETKPTNEQVRLFDNQGGYWAIFGMIIGFACGLLL